MKNITVSIGDFLEAIFIEFFSYCILFNLNAIIENTAQWKNLGFCTEKYRLKYDEWSYSDERNTILVL